MALKRPSGLGNNGHGIRPFGYIAEFAVPSETNGYADPRRGPWSERLVQVTSIQLGYGPADQVAQLQSCDPKAISDDTDTAAKRLIVVPRNGECVRITMVDAKGGRTLAFKGTIRGMHERRSSSGIVWSCEAISEVSRLNDLHFTGNYNVQDDAITPSPHFDPATGELVTARLYSVKEIVEQILKFQDAWGTDEYFGIGDIDWQGLDADARCGKFVPTTLNFSNTPKGQAILETLQKAGNFTFVYDPGSDKLRIVELNENCDNCGSRWAIPFASPYADDIDADSAYAFDYVVTEDRTSWTTREVANVCRMVSGPIQFYSGNWIIPERVRGGEDSTRDDGLDTAAKQRMRAISPDGCYYRFHMPTQVGVHDTRTLQRYFVGMPLFPDWNIFEDWFPAVYEIGSVFVPADWRASDYTDDNQHVKTGFPNPANYAAKGEYQPFCLGDAVARKEVHLGHQDNLRAWQAWYAVNPCPACKGSGLVKKVYGNAENEPDIKLVAKGPAGHERMVIEVTNWIMNPSDFGACDSNGVRLAPPAGLVPFYDDNGNADTTGPTGGYPLPWKNTCPYCRGTGMKPEYKIRNIGQSLFTNRNLQVPVNPATNNDEIPADPDYTSTGPETWEQAASRISLSEGPMLQVEVPVAYRYTLPVYANRDLDWKDIDSLKARTPDQARRKFPHPLQYVNVRKAVISSVQGVTVASGDAQGRDKLVPDSWYCTVPFTTVQIGAPCQPQIDYKLGRVLFSEPMFIPCNKDYATIQLMSNNRARVETTGLLSTHAPARGFTTSDDRGLPTGYWRPARVWMMFTYTRDLYYDSMRKDRAGRAIGDVTITRNGQTYRARAKIMDGRWCLEVKKTNPATNEVAGGRVVQAPYAEDGAVIQIYEKDLWKAPVLNVLDKEASDISVKIAKGWTVSGSVTQPIPNAPNQYEFCLGRVFKWLRPTPGELMVERAGYSDADHFSSLCRPVTFNWTLRDARPKLLGMAIRRLEMANDIQVEGSLSIVGPIGDLTHGLGYVNYPDKGLAAVKKVTYNLSDGFVTELELHREETRIGELPLTDRERMNELNKSVANLARTNELINQAARQNGQGNTRHGAMDASTTQLTTNAAG